MPVISSTSYSPPAFFSNGHIQTLYPTLFRRLSGVVYRRHRIVTPDDDFLDLDWSEVGANRLAILSHGLEGSSTRPYMLGMVRALNNKGWDALAWNFRGCSGEPNKRLRFYHSGDTADLGTVVSHVLTQDIYREIALIGFSMGGNMSLKYLGERKLAVDPLIKKAAVFSVPCDLRSASIKMAEPANTLYMKRFLRMLHEKIKAKMQVMPGRIDDEGYHRIRTFREFDDRYTAPLHGFTDAEDYWQRASCKPFLQDIRVPSLLVNARNDPFLAASCYPLEEARSSRHLFLEMPSSGGHVGFVAFNSKGEYWSESRAVSFISSHP